MSILYTGFQWCTVLPDHTCSNVRGDILSVPLCVILFVWNDNTYSIKIKKQTQIHWQGMELCQLKIHLQIDHLIYDGWTNIFLICLMSLLGFVKCWSWVFAHPYMSLTLTFRCRKLWLFQWGFPRWVVHLEQDSNIVMILWAGFCSHPTGYCTWAGLRAVILNIFSLRDKEIIKEVI